MNPRCHPYDQQLKNSTCLSPQHAHSALPALFRAFIFILVPYSRLYLFLYSLSRSLRRFLYSGLRTWLFCIAPSYYTSRRPPMGGFCTRGKIPSPCRADAISRMPRIDKLQRRCNQGDGLERILMHRPWCHTPPCQHMPSPASSSLFSDVPFPFCLPQSHLPSSVLRCHFPFPDRVPFPTSLTFIHYYRRCIVSPRLSLLVANRRASPPCCTPPFIAYTLFLASSFTLQSYAVLHSLRSSFICQSHPPPFNKGGVRRDQTISSLMASVS